LNGDEIHDPHDEIVRLEEHIEELAATIESCRKFILVSQVAVVGGGLVLVAMLFAVIWFDPAVMAAAVSASSEYHLLTDGTHLYLRTSARQVVDLLKNARQPMFLLCVTDQVRRFTATPLRKPAKSETAGAVRKVRAL